MAKIIVEDEGEQEVPDGASLTQAVEELGIPIGCADGLCQACRVEVVDGSQNLTDLTQAEKDIGLDGTERLACQCKIKQGTVTFRY